MKLKFLSSKGRNFQRGRETAGKRLFWISLVVHNSLHSKGEEKGLIDEENEVVK